MVSSHSPSWTSCPSAILPDTHSPAEWGGGSQWKRLFPTRSFLGPAQPIRGGLLVHLTLFLAGDSQWRALQHTWCIVVRSLVVGRTPTQVPWIRAIILSGGQSNASSHYYVAWHTFECLRFVLFVRVRACMRMCASEELCNPIPIMLCSLISRPLSLRSWLHPLLETQQWALCCPLKELEASAIKRDSN